MAISLESSAKAEKQRQRSYEKQRASLERQRQKQREKQADPEYRASKFEQQQRHLERQRERQMEKLCDPEYIERMKQNKAASIERSIAKRKAKPPAIIKSDTKKTISTRKASPIKSKGLKGRTPTALERKLMDKIGALPCAACSAMGKDNTLIALHHVDGRVKEFAHAKVLPLCAYHHDVPLTPEERAIHGDMFPVHAKGSYGGKKAFENEYGTQEFLLSVVYELIGEPRPWLVT